MPVNKAVSEEPLAFSLLTEIGIIEQLSSNILEQGLPDGLKLSQFVVLHHFCRLGGDWNPVRLANAFQVTKGAMTNTLQRLEKRGLVTIRPNPCDGRGKLVSITKAGRDMRKQCIKSVDPVIASLSEKIAREDLLVALSVLENIRKRLDTNRP
ncbi:MAG: MarR family winged helix-turn-helix transcriptional regulator [Xanthomonadales bacterium]|nr:MarR family winged helix-turn-helix transcriptional regulator [Xanthomonadales bacterium]